MRGLDGKVHRRSGRLGFVVCLQRNESALKEDGKEAARGDRRAAGRARSPVVPVAADEEQASAETDVRDEGAAWIAAK